MCSEEEKIQMIREGKGYTFSKTNFWVSTGLTFAIILAGFIITFTTVKLQAENNREQSELNRKDVITLKEDMKKIDRIDMNLKNLCIQMDVEYID